MDESQLHAVSGSARGENEIELHFVLRDTDKTLVLLMSRDAALEFLRELAAACESRTRDEREYWRRYFRSARGEDEDEPDPTI